MKLECLFGHHNRGRKLSRYGFPLYLCKDCQTILMKRSEPEGESLWKILDEDSKYWYVRCIENPQWGWENWVYIVSKGTTHSVFENTDVLVEDWKKGTKVKVKGDIQ